MILLKRCRQNLCFIKTMLCITENIKTPPLLKQHCKKKEHSKKSSIQNSKYGVFCYIYNSDISL